MKPEHQRYLEQYTSTLTEQQRQEIPDVIAEYFCADEFNANECARLVNAGIKRASCSLKAAYELDQEPLPRVGRLTVVLDWDGNPVCIVRLTEVSFCPFNIVPEEFAHLEGEGDGSYQWWYKAHLKFFNDYAKSIGSEFSLTDELVLERFEKVYPED